MSGIYIRGDEWPSVSFFREQAVSIGIFLNFPREPGGNREIAIRWVEGNAQGKVPPAFRPD